MSFFLDRWNKLMNRSARASPGVPLGMRVMDGEITKRPYLLDHAARSEHIVILGKTGTGKTSLIKAMLDRDIRDGRGFLCIDLHGDLTPFILGRIAEREQLTGIDCARRTVLINPGSPRSSVGLNVLRTTGALAPHISEVVAIFRQRWHLDHFGARTDELLRNSLWVLAEAGLTPTELSPFLTDLSFRAPLVGRCGNAEVRDYFRSRYEQLSEAMQAVVREAILNKVSAFTTDPAVRHLVGQADGLDLLDAIHRGLWIVLSLSRSRLGENSETLAALVLTRFKNAVYARRNRNLFTLYADEVQNLVTSEATFDHLISEARKFGISLVTANQHLGQYSPQMRATLLSAGTLVSFRPSPEDAPLITKALDGRQQLERSLKELPNRRFVIRSGSSPPLEVAAIGVAHNTISTASLVTHSDAIWAKPRTAIESEIMGRRTGSRREDVGTWY